MNYRNGGPRVFDKTFREMARPGVPVNVFCAKGSIGWKREIGYSLSRKLLGETPFSSEKTRLKYRGLSKPTA